MVLSFDCFGLVCCFGFRFDFNVGFDGGPSIDVDLGFGGDFDVWFVMV